MWLQAVDDRFVSAQDAYNVRRIAIPDEEGAVIRASNNELAVTGKEQRNSNQPEPRTSNIS